MALGAVSDGISATAIPGCFASSRANPSACINSSTVPGSMIASQVNAGTIDIHTCPWHVVMVTVAGTPSLPLVETLRGIPMVGNVY